LTPVKVVVHGASGKMGQEVLNSLCREPGIEIVGAVDIQVPQNFLSLPDGSGIVPFSNSLEQILDTCQPDVVVDFSTAKAVMPAVRLAVKKGIRLVIGTTGFSSDELSEMEQLAKTHKVGIMVAPNFALGAVLMMHLAKIAGKYMDYAEILELHHHLKADAPSGTALSTARAMAQSRGRPFSRPAEKGAAASRGQEVEGINIHSVRLLGLLAHQEVILGAAGQTLRIRHDQISREAFMPGVILAVKEVVKRQGLIYGLDTLLNL
jgi:4-hydroxy-tetrahydrodipicolinate reductase